MPSPSPADRSSRSRTAARSAAARATAVSRTAGTRAAWWDGDAPRRWLLAIAAALYVARVLLPSEAVAWQGDGVPLVMLWLAAVLAWATFGALGGRLTVRIGLVDVAVLALVVWHSLAAVWAMQQAAPRPALNMLWEWLALAAGYWILRQQLRTPREARALLAGMLALAVAQAAYGYVDYFYTLPQLRAEYQADPDRALEASGQWFPPGSLERERFEQRLGSVEPPGTFGLTNSLAGFLAAWLAVLVAAATCHAPWMRPLRTAWYASLAAAVAIAGCLLLTKSRAAWLALLAGLAGVWLIDRSRRLPARVVAGLAIVLGLLVGGALLAGGLDREVLSEAPKSLVYRFEYWRATAAMIARHPWVGCGPGQFQDRYTQFRLPTSSEEIADPHNLLLEVWATAGTPAAIALMVAAGALAAACWRRSAAGPSIGKPAGESRGESSGQTRGQSSRESRRTSSPASSGELAAGHEAGRGAHSLSPTAADDAYRLIYWAALAGFPLAAAVSFLFAPLVYVPLTVGAMAGGLAVAAVVLWLLRAWIRDGWLPAWVPACGLVCLTINLLGAGGIGYPGVAGSLWLLAAVTLFVAPQQPRTRSVGRAGAAATALVCGALFAACYASSFLPRVASTAAMSQAVAEPQRAAEHLAAATAADPWASEPWQQLADLELQQWLLQPSDDRLARFQHAARQAQALRPHSSAVAARVGEWHLAVYARTRRDEHRQAAIDALRRSVELHPTSASRRAVLAEALQSTADPAATDEAGRALELDRQTPHLDQRLAPEVRRRLEALTRPE